MKSGAGGRYDTGFPLVLVEALGGTKDQGVGEMNCGKEMRGF